MLRAHATATNRTPRALKKECCEPTPPRRIAPPPPEDQGLETPLRILALTNSRTAHGTLVST